MFTNSANKISILRAHILFHIFYWKKYFNHAHDKPSRSHGGIPRTNVPGLHIAIFRIYLLLCSYVLCAEIYFSTTSQPEPTEPW